MSTPAILGQLVLGHSPLIARDRSVIATRLTVFPEKRDESPDAAALLQALMHVWPAPADAATISLNLRAMPGQAPGAAADAAPVAPTKATPLTLNIASEPWLRAMLAVQPPPHVMLEVPAFMVGDPVHAAALQALHAAGSALIVKGRPVTELPRELLPCFRHSLIDAAEDRRGGGSQPPEGVARRISHIQVGVRTLAELDAAFARGAVGVLGWPIEDEFRRGSVQAGGPDLAVVTELIKRVDREEPVDKLEAVLKNDPQLAFRLIRYLNSAAFGLSVEVSSFQHALMMLGYQKLKRWLALLLASSSKDPQMKPAMFAAVRRGLLMEELVRHSADDEMRGEMFICGVFSLLDRMLGQDFATLFESVPVPDRVQQALVAGGGPFHPYLQLVRAMEQGVRGDIRDAADTAFVSLTEANAALLRALASARELD
ncbi:EAL and HDOD domain-containing protein [Rubrivivax albus]|uniref:HDOD domain-containing protein n=1 Tax=Rubrivivax albus TaxID=2499835 RepID=A0A437K234_9BURK|nr:HDOD domain-containing protein [Rubrivivax albus]RVT54345.1 HDOD domain-containing protein [Rubrivivax albus]